jgi:hypothetical protein
MFYYQGRTAMWLHHRDMNVSGKPRCPGSFVPTTPRWPCRPRLNPASVFQRLEVMLA